MQEPGTAEAYTGITPEGHGKTSDGEQACCAIWSAELVDCAACLSSVTQPLLDSSSAEEAAVLKTLLEALEDAGPEGLKKDELQVGCQREECTAFVRADGALQRLVKQSDQGFLSAQIARLTDGTLPVAFWTGYKEVVLVSSQHLSSWAVVTEQDDARCVRVLPRRWLDIDGRVMSEVWHAGCKAAMGITVFHPGISQVGCRFCRVLYPVPD
jgi:oxalate---CoA ligase